MVLQANNSPFTQEQADLLNRLLPTLTEYQRTWLGGYLTALQATGAPLAAQALVEAIAPSAVQTASVSAVAEAPVAIHETAISVSVPKEVTVLFGSQTGNSHGLASKLSSRLKEKGYEVVLSSMNDYKTNGLKKVKNLLVVVSTHGEGEPPDSAISFYEFLHSKRAPKLDGLRYSVLALGDTSYEFFCQTGKDFDQRLEELGAERIVPRQDCDVDFVDTANEWMDSVIGALDRLVQGTVASSAVTGIGVTNITTSSGGEETVYSRSNPFLAEVLENINLNGRGSERETRHLELSLEGSNLQYEPGDSIGIIPQNHPRLVDEVIQALGFCGEELVSINKSGDKRSVKEALLRHFEITVLTKPLLEQAAKLSDSPKLKTLVEPGHEQDMRTYIAERDLLDLVTDFSFSGVTAEQFVSILRKIPPRLYSIASSPQAYPDEVHITVRTVRYEAHGRQRYGVCSVQLAERVEPGDYLPIFIQPNPNFKLPDNPETPIIMIGPGTGVAPFRAFLGEREETGATGKSWLFYGDQHFSTDFLYQVEWQRWLKEGVLTRMDVAFSRDTDKKVYVQHRMLEKSRDLYEWLQEGAVVYVCGDEKKMAHDVHAALLTILEQEGGLTQEQATEYLARMQQEKRYQRDVY